MSKNIAQRKVERKRKLINRKRRIQYRLRDINWAPQDKPMFTAGNIHYELADRVRALGTQRIPDPTTAGDFCRRFERTDIQILMNVINDVRVGVWQEQPKSFFTEAIIDAMPNLIEHAENLPEKQWKRLKRPPKYKVKTVPRQRPDNVKERIVRERGFKNIRLKSEEVAEFSYRPVACEKTYRVVVVRKNLSVEKGEQVLFDDIRYFFYITNERFLPADEIVFLANDRCNQENLIEQLKNGVRAMQMPVDNLISNWAYMVMVSLAWTLKAWFALSLPDTGRWAAKYKSEKSAVLRMEFKTFLNAFMRVPCQIIRAGGRIVYRLLAWNPWQHVFLRGVDALHTMSTWRHPLRC